LRSSFLGDRTLLFTHKPVYTNHVLYKWIWSS
jgi:hypothetical protein